MPAKQVGCRSIPFLRVVERRGQPRVEEILDTLVALGHARRTDSGYAPA